MLLTALDLILDATYQIKQILKTVLPSVLLTPQVGDLSFILQEVPEELISKLFDAVQNVHLKKLEKVRSWQSNLEADFKTCY